MKKRVLILTVIFTALLVACSGGGSKSSVKIKDAEKIAKMSPANYAKEVKAIHLDAHEKVDKLLEKHATIDQEFADSFWEVMDNAIKQLYPYGEALDTKTADEKMEYFLACTMNDGMAERTEYVNRINARIGDFDDDAKVRFNDVTSLNTLTIIIDFEKVRNEYPSLKEKFGIE